MATFTVKVEGLDRLRASVDEKARELEKEIDAEIDFAVDEAIGYMQTDAPADQGFLRGRINKEHNKTAQYTIVSESDYSAYLEFGTGSKVVIPAGLADVASQARGASNSDPLSAKQAIFAWCSRNKIDPKLWYPIYISIMVNGISPHPFFFHNFERVKPKLLERIEKLLKVEGF